MVALLLNTQLATTELKIEEMKPASTTKDSKLVTEIDNAEIFCNCWKTVKTLYYPDLPLVNVILNNLSDTVGEIAVFYYPKSGLYHFAKVTSHNDQEFSIDEGNYYSCQRSKRTLSYQYKNLLGFYHMP